MLRIESIFVQQIDSLLKVDVHIANVELVNGEYKTKIVDTLSATSLSNLSAEFEWNDEVYHIEFTPELYAQIREAALKIATAINTNKLNPVVKPYKTKDGQERKNVYQYAPESARIPFTLNERTASIKPGVRLGANNKWNTICIINFRSAKADELIKCTRSF